MRNPLPLAALFLPLLLACASQPRTVDLHATEAPQATSTAGVAAAPAATTKEKKDVPYVPTPPEVVEGMLDLGEVGPGDVVYDLGSGDGRVVIAAAKRGARAVGVDIDEGLLAQARANAEAEGVAHLTEFRKQDLFETDVREADVVTLYLLPSVNLKLKPRLQEQLRPGARIVSHSFSMGEWKPEENRMVNGRAIYLWTIPKR